MKEAITFDRFVRMLGMGLLILLIVWLINRLSGVLLPFAVAWLLAYLLYPMVRFVQYRLHVPGRVLSIIVTMLTVIAVIAFVVWLIIPPMIEQFQKLGQLVTVYIQKSAHVSNIPEAIREWIQTHGDDLKRILNSSNFSEGLKTILPRMFTVIGQTASIIVSIFASLITLLYMFFILLDYEYLTDSWLKIFPPKRRPFWQALAIDAER